MVVFKTEEIFKKRLEREQKIIAKWKDTINVIDGTQASNKDRKTFEQEADESTDDDHPFTDNPPTDNSYPLKTQK